MSRSRPISAPGSTAAASSTAAERADTFREEKVVSAQRWAMAPQRPALELGIAESNLFLLLVGAGAGGTAVRRAAAADRHRLRPVHQARPRCAELRPLPGFAVHPGRDPVRPDAGARGRRAPVADRAADRHRPARARPRSSRPMPTSLRCCCAGRSRKSSARTAIRSISGCRPGRSTSPRARLDAGARRRRSSPARIGCASRRPAPISRSPIAARSRRTRSPRTRRSLEDMPGAGLLAVTSPGSLYRDWQESLRDRTDRASPNVCWRGCARARRWSPSPTVTRRRCRGSARWRATRIVPLGVDRFGQSGDIPDLYREYGIDADAIIDAAARACLRADRTP